MRPLTHDDPHAIPRNGTDVPWPDVPAPAADEGSGPEHHQDRPDGSDSQGRAAGPGA